MEITLTMNGFLFEIGAMIYLDSVQYEYVQFKNNMNSKYATITHSHTQISTVVVIITLLTKIFHSFFFFVGNDRLFWQLRRS